MDEENQKLSLPPDKDNDEAQEVSYQSKDLRNQDAKKVKTNEEDVLPIKETTFKSQAVSNIMHYESLAVIFFAWKH